MSLVHVLEDFGRHARSHSELTEADVTDAQQLASYDEGYKAGWDDALKAEENDRKHITSDFAQNLQDLSFTYHEAHAAVMASVTPLFEEMLTNLLPQMARETMGAHVVDQLTNLTRQIGAVPVQVMVAEGQEAPVRQLIEGSDCSLPVEIRESPDLVDGQAELRFEDGSANIDLESVTRQIAEAVRGVLYETPRKAANG